MCGTCDEKFNRKSNKVTKSKKRKEKCLENEEKTKQLPKCPKPKGQPRKPKKCLTEIEKIMLRIQPPIADRERYMHPEHVNCFLEESERVVIKKPKCTPCPPERPKKCIEDKTIKKKPNVNAEGEEDKDKKTGKDTDNNTEPRESEQEGQENIEPKKEEEKIEQGTAKGRAKKNLKKKNEEKHKQKQDKEGNSDSEMSIRSNDSQICLAGINLTIEDKEKIEENRRKVHPAPDNEENSTKRSTRESEDKQ